MSDYSDDMTSSSTSYSTGDGTSYDPIYETTTYTTPVADTTSYETTSYEPVSYEATTYSTAPTNSYEAMPFEPITTDPYAIVTETGSTSYDSTDWSAVADVSGDLHDSYLAQTDLANTYYQMSTDASLAGDSSLAYDLNQMSLDTQAGASADWTASNQVWTDMDVTTTETTYDVSYTDTSAAYVDPSYVDTSSAYTDTSYVDTSSTYVDTSSTYTDTTSYTDDSGY